MLQPAVFQGNVQDDEGNVQAGAQISVTSVLTGLPVTLFSDLSDAPLTNPFNAGSNGEFQFFYEGELINITATSGGFSRTWTNEYTNIYGLKDNLLNTTQTITAPYTFTAPNIYTAPLNINAGTLWNGVYCEEIANPNGGVVLAFLGVRGLNTFDLSNSNTVGTQSDQGASRLGIEEMMTRRFNDDLGDAAFDDKTSPSAAIWDSGNLNPNLFSGDSNNDVLLLGRALNSTTVIIYADTSLVNDSVSQVFSGTFKLFSYLSGSDISTGITTLTPSGLRTNKLTRFSVSGLSGLTINDTIELRCDGGAASILIE